MDRSELAVLYARLTGAALLLVGIVGIVSLAAGYVGVLALDFLAWDTTHNVLHLVLGAIALYVGFAPRPYLDAITYAKVFGVVYLLLTVVGIGSPTALASLGVHLELGENLVHLLVGGLGLAVAYYPLGRRSPASGGRSPAR